MDESVERQPRRAVRVLLLAAGAGLLWAGVSLLSQGGAAHAADGDELGGGLVGIVAGVASGASDAVGAVTDAVAQVAPPVAPVTDAASTAVTQVTGTVTHVVESAPAVVPDVAPIVTPVVTEVVQPVVDHVAQPVVDTAAELTAPVPVVGTVVGAIDLSGTVAAVPGVVEAVDGVVDTTLTGSPAPDLIAELPLENLLPAVLVPADPIVGIALPNSGNGLLATPAARGDSLRLSPVESRTATEPSASTAGASSADGTSGHIRTTSPLLAPSSPPPPSGAGTSGAPGAEALAGRTPSIGLLLFSVAAPAADDRLPACPVFDTDTSPD
jgi:hypothetical protein